jgi:hypothetical protein
VDEGFTEREREREREREMANKSKGCCVRVNVCVCANKNDQALILPGCGDRGIISAPTACLLASFRV